MTKLYEDHKPEANKNEGFPHVSSSIRKIAQQLGWNPADPAPETPDKAEKSIHPSFNAKFKPYKKAKKSGRDKQKNKKQSLRPSLPPRLKRIQIQLAKLGVDQEARLCPKEVWDMCRLIMSDNSGHAVKLYMDRCKNQVARALIDRAALGDGRYCYQGGDRRARRARRIAALGLAMVALGVPWENAERLGVEYEEKPDRWSQVVETFPIEMFLHLLKDPDSGEIPHRNAFSRTCKTAPNAIDCRVGYLTALKNVGFIESWQKKTPIRDGSTGGNIKDGWLRVFPNVYLIVTCKIPADDSNSELKNEIQILWFTGNTGRQTPAEHYVAPVNVSDAPSSGSDPPSTSS